MAKKEQGKFTPPPLGGSSLLVVFAVLSLTVFALLGLSTVRADRRLGDRSAQAVADYYAADAQAQEVLARLRQGEKPEGVAESGGVYTYTTPVSDSQALEMTVKLSDGKWQVLRWQAVFAGDWHPQETLEVWKGE